MNKFFTFLRLLAILSLSCSSVTDLFPKSAPVEATGPILGMTVAASLDDQGRPVGESFTYPADEPQLVVLVRIGEVTPGPLSFSWLRVTETGDESIFVQTVQVEARDLAFSSGLNPGSLAAGTYKVIATFAGESETITWDVAEPLEDPTAAVSTTASAAGSAPAPGPSGKTAGVFPQLPLTDISRPYVSPSIYLWKRAPYFEFGVLSGWNFPQNSAVGIPPSSFSIRVNAAINGAAPGMSWEYVHTAGKRPVDRVYPLDPCILPNGSDLPGTSITVSAFPIGYEANLLTDTKILGDDTSRPTFNVAPSIKPGSKVNPGDQIVLTVTGEELKSGGSWQMGIYRMQVTGPAGLVGDSWTNPSRLPKACRAKTWSHVEKFTYTVPQNPPAKIDLCILVEDYAGNFNKRSCGTYYTGNQLKGKLTSITTSLTSVGNGGTYVDQSDADLSLTLQADGTLTGTAQIAYSRHGEGTQSCGSWSHSFDPLKLTFPVSGHWTEEAIDFHFTLDDPIMTTGIFTGCGTSETSQFDVRAATFGGNSVTVGESTNFQDWHANWDGQAYTADDIFSTADIEWHWTIHLEPPAPGVGSNPAPLEAAGGDQASVIPAHP